ncbi:hypothetical protein HDF16_002242 [Granulicella aggregans]|jgi:hypothetical protein|uniref:Uncharacterized protein n=1 Tax=Granulicella aggregans TaxID=474949 RepID=A0A7W7ZDV7_9BACT|nr:hypothetical protein [Granulicella aggregans]MBB5057536.1 hypothetical protein [Granulicella aggregans]
MSTFESSTSKPHQSGTWNALRSRSIPSGVSGSHPVAKPPARVTTDESILLKAEKEEVEYARKQLKDFRPLRPTLAKN